MRAASVESADKARLTVGRQFAFDFLDLASAKPREEPGLLPCLSSLCRLFSLRAAHCPLATVGVQDDGINQQLDTVS